jgi:hypothetical protein
VSRDKQLLALDRTDGHERLVVRWLDDGQRHAVEVAIERKTTDGWRPFPRIVVRLSELHLVHDAIGRACELAGGVRR